MVMVSTVGVRDDWPPMRWTFVGKIFGFMLLCPGLNTHACKDITAAEEHVCAQSEARLDYLIVRPMCLDAGEVTRGLHTVELHEARSLLPLHLNIAKEDVATFMLQEALQVQLKPEEGSSTIDKPLLLVTRPVLLCHECIQWCSVVSMPFVFRVMWYVASWRNML